SVGKLAIDRRKAVPPAVGAWFSTGLTLSVGILLLVSQQRDFGIFSRRRPPADKPRSDEETTRSERRTALRLSIASFPTLLDLGIMRMMILSFLFGFIALV